MSAFMWQVVHQKKILLYDKVDEFVTMVTEVSPELIGHREKIQLLLGLRAKVSKFDLLTVFICFMFVVNNQCTDFLFVCLCFSFF